MNKNLLIAAGAGTLVLLGAVLVFTGENDPKPSEGDALLGLNNLLETAASLQPVEDAEGYYSSDGRHDYYKNLALPLATLGGIESTSILLCEKAPPVGGVDSKGWTCLVKVKGFNGSEVSHDWTFTKLKTGWIVSPATPTTTEKGET